MHEITIEPYAGESGTGSVYGPPGAVRCLLDEQTRMVRSPSGDLVTSTATAYCGVGTVAPSLSQATLPNGRRTTVIAAKDRSAKGLGTPDHVEIQMQ
ncbi:hypothetical protein ACWF94_06195 [Streptomyces sp. NPDC055078]